MDLYDIKTAVREWFSLNGWIEMTKGDIYFDGDLLFFKEEYDDKMLYLVDVSNTHAPRVRVKRDAYKLWNEFKDQAKIFYSYATPTRMCKRTRQCKRRYCNAEKRRRLRSFR